MYRKLGASIGVPDLRQAREYAKSLLPHDQDGKLLPLSCPIECFQVFGSGVYAYMRWTQLMKNIFFVCFLFSLANMVNNIFGGELQVTALLPMPAPTEPASSSLSPVPPLQGPLLVAHQV